MADTLEHELTPEEMEQLTLVEESRDALSAMVEDLSSHSRRKRQTAARVIKLLAERDAAKLVPFAEELIDALYRPEAQTRWEILDALTLLMPAAGDVDFDAAYDGAEDALFDELSATLRLSAFRFMAAWGAVTPARSTKVWPVIDEAIQCYHGDLELFDELSATLRLSAFRFMAAWGAVTPARSTKVWPVIDEAIQCYHGDLEYRDMLGSLYEFARGDIDAQVAAELAGRIRFDAENGKGAYLKARSSEIYGTLLERFKLEKPQKRTRAAAKADDEDEE